MRVEDLFSEEKSVPRRSPRRETSLYRVGGLRVPSVTEVLDLSGISDIERLIAVAGADVVDAASHRGNQVHGYCHAFDLARERGQGSDLELVPAPYRGFVRAYERFLAESGFQVVYAEHVVVSERYAFAGTVDRIGFLRSGQPAVIDLKTPAQAVPSWPVQTAGYALAAADCGLVERSMRGALRLRANGTYRLDPHEDRRDTDLFLAALSLTHWKLAHGVSQLED